MLELTTPQAGKKASISTANTNLKVSVEGGQKYSSGDQVYNEAEIIELLKQNIDGTIFLKASDTAQVQDMVLFLDMAARLGVTNLRLADISHE